MGWMAQLTRRRRDHRRGRALLPLRRLGSSHSPWRHCGSFIPATLQDRSFTLRKVSTSRSIRARRRLRVASVVGAGGHAANNIVAIG